MTEGKKFLDPEGIKEPTTADELFPVDGDRPSPIPAAVDPGPCEDCKRYAQLGYVFGVVVGVSLGGICAWIILKNRLAPRAV